MSQQQQQQQGLYSLSSVLVGHTDQVRSVCAYPLLNNGVATCGFDRTIHLWEELTEQQYRDKQEEEGEGLHAMTDDDATVSADDSVEKLRSRYESMATLVGGHTNFVVDVEHVPCSTQADRIVSVSHDGSIVLWNGADGSIYKKIANAHAKPVSCVSVFLDQSDAKHYILSGSWDNTAKVWTVDGDLVHHLKGHEMNVLCVLGLPTGDIVTGCADGTIKLWRNGIAIRTMRASSTCVRGLTLLPDVGFLSCANDGMIKLWTFLGEETHQFQAHDTLVYALCVNTADGEIISCSEDNSIKVWRNFQCVQTIAHPNTVWRAVCLFNGDIVTACADGKARVWTRHSDRVAQSDVLGVYDRALEKSKKKVGGVNMNELPTAGALSEQGKKDGEIKVVNEDGNARAYSWNAAQGQWDLVGDVVEGPGVGDSFAGKEVLNGTMYDHVFDIELESGTKRKLGFNNGENPYDIAQRFIEEHGLSPYHIEPIVQFIMNNFANFVNTEASASQRVLDPWSDAAAAAAGARATAVPAVQQQKPQPLKQHFPCGYDINETANYAGIARKIKEFNIEIKNDVNIRDVWLTTEQEHVLDQIVTLLQQQQYIDTRHLELMDLLLRWPLDKLFPALDLARCVILRDEAATHIAQSPHKHVERLLAVVFRSPNTSVIAQMMLIRFLSNMFKSTASRKVIAQQAETVFGVIAPVCNTTAEERLRSAYAKLLRNFMVYASTEDAINIGIAALNSANVMLSSQQPLSADVAHSLLCGLGTLIHSKDNARQIAKEMGLSSLVGKYRLVQDASVAGAANQLADLLK